MAPVFVSVAGQHGSNAVGEQQRTGVISLKRLRPSPFPLFNIYKERCDVDLNERF